MAKDNPEPTERPPSSMMSRPALRSIGLAALTLFGVALCAVVVYPLLAPILWALVLAIVVRPLYRRVEARVGRPSIAAGLVVVALALLVALPLAFIAVQLVQELAELTTRFRSGDATRLWQDVIGRLPLVSKLLEWAGRHVDLQELVGQWTGGSARLLQRVLSGSVASGAGWLIMFFLLFFFLRDSARMLATVTRFLPLAQDEMRELFKVTADTIHATVWGTLAVGLVQGALGALIFWWLDLPAPFVWGAVMALLSVLPVLGAAIVWVPFSAYFALQGEWTSALILAGFGAIVIGLIDNLIYPLIVKDRMHLHAVPVFVSIIGGLIVFGASGIVLGPVLLAITDTLVTIWRRRLGMRDTVKASP